MSILNIFKKSKKPALESQKETEVDGQEIYGQEWVYSDEVRKHFFEPQNFVTEAPVDYDGLGLVGSPACLHPLTPVVSKQSIKVISSFRRKEKVLSHDSDYHSIEKIFCSRYPGKDLIKIKNSLGELIATPDHLIYAKQIPGKITYWHNTYKRKIFSNWVHAADLRKKDVILYPIPDKITNNLKFIEFLQEKKKWDFKSKSIPKHIKITADFLEFCGYFLAEGYTKKTDVGLCFNDKEMHLAERVKQLVKNIFNLESKILIKELSHTINVSIYNVFLANNLRKIFGTSAATKQIPEQLFLLNPSLQKGLIKGIWLGDGYFADWRKQPRAGFTTISPVLCQQLIFLLLRQRIIPSVYKETAKIIKGVNHQPAYRIHVGDMNSLQRLAEILGIKFRHKAFKRTQKHVWFEDNYVCLPIRSVSKVSYDGIKLFNFEVAKSHSYATDAFLVHNCGDMMKVWIKVDKKTDTIKDFKWQTFGCASAIAATSMLSVMVTENGGMKVDDALKITPTDIIKRLSGLPARKIHCSVLGDKALEAAVNDYFRRTGQIQRIKAEGARVIDNVLNITDKDIEQAVKDGAKTVAEVQEKTKVGTGDPHCLLEVEELIRYYVEKYYT